MNHLIKDFTKKHDPATCEAAFALVAAVLQDRSIPTDFDDKDDLEDFREAIDRAASEFTAAASDAGRRAKEGKE